MGVMIVYGDKMRGSLRAVSEAMLGLSDAVMAVDFETPTLVWRTMLDYEVDCIVGSRALARHRKRRHRGS